jgi:uncharacterized membrane protein YphA (DoxX/SURF4 family)
MNSLHVVLQVIVAVGLLNVWLLRFNKSTPYRGGSAKNLKDEFKVYGLPEWFMYLVGALKIGAAVALLVGIWVPALVPPAAALVVVLMLGALVMHVKAGDPIMKSMPAGLMLVMGLLMTLAVSI